MWLWRAYVVAIPSCIHKLNLHVLLHSQFTFYLGRLQTAAVRHRLDSMLETHWCTTVCSLLRCTIVWSWPIHSVRRLLTASVSQELPSLLAVYISQEEATCRLFTMPHASRIVAYTPIIEALIDDLFSFCLIVWSWLTVVLLQSCCVW